MQPKRAMRTLWLALALTLFAAWQAAAKTPLPTFGEKTTYAEARAELIAKGFTPMRNGGQNWNDCEDHPDLCQQFPELTDCIDNAGSDCGFLWKTPDGDYVLLSAAGCCEHWIYGPETEFYGPRYISAEDARATLAGPDPSLPRLSRKLRYPQTRRRLIALGYIPQRVSSDQRKEDCIYSYKAMCHRYAELESCGNAFCTFVFRRRSDDRLVIVRIRSEFYGFYDIYYPDPGALGDELIRPPRRPRPRARPGETCPAGRPRPDFCGIHPASFASAAVGRSSN
jgi:hypothetical protein